jgi:alpha-beta hydrolase superfamily lysophospholipase
LPAHDSTGFRSSLSPYDHDHGSRRKSRLTPIVFGGCFGWHHPGTSTQGVVLCGPHGEEELLVHHAWYRFAEMLAGKGMHAVRFDYRGTGNSAEDDGTPGRVAAWRESVVAAAEFLRTQVGVSEISLVGFRLGALMAVLAAEMVPAVTSIVLLAPVASGKSYVRELRILSTFRPQLAEAIARKSDDLAKAWRSRGAAGNSTIEVLGFTYLPETLRDLEQHSLFQISARPAARMLMLQEPRQALDDRLTAHFRSLGAEVDEWPFQEYRRLMLGPPGGEFPAELFAQLAEWLNAAPATPRPASRSSHASVSLQLADSVEIARMFGRGDHLFGVVTQPAIVRSDLPVLVFLNTWWNHHIGYGRLAVTMARRFAAAGYSSFRFDVSGVGDSAAEPGREGTLPLIQHAMPDVQAALDHLQDNGYSKFLLIGVCWGGGLAFQASLQDKRVAGALLINPLLNPGTSRIGRPRPRALRDYLALARMPQTWRRLFRGEVNVYGTMQSLATSAANRIRHLFRAMVLQQSGRNATPQSGPCPAPPNTWIIVSAGGSDATDLQKDALEGSHPFFPGSMVETIPSADHVFSSSAARQQLAAIMEAKLKALS